MTSLFTSFITPEPPMFLALRPDVCMLRIGASICRHLFAGQKRASTPYISSDKALLGARSKWLPTNLCDGCTQLMCR